MPAEKTIHRTEPLPGAPDFKTLIERIPNLVACFDRGGRYLYVNNSFAKMAGEKEMAEFATLAGKTLQKVFDTGRVEIAEMRIDGKIYKTTFVPQSGPDGQVASVITYSDDITEQKRSQENLVRSYERVNTIALGVIAMISRMVEVRDQYTAGHQRHVAQLAHAIGAEMGLPAWQTEGIRIAGLVHDIGKLSVPIEILNKMGRLTPVEVSIIRIHPATGYDILKDIEFPWPIAEVAHQHQERIDGSGYPQGLRGEEIKLEARIVSVADVVEAMTFHRPYREPIGRDKALEQIRHGSGVLYDPPAAEACLKLFAEDRFHFDA